MATQKQVYYVLMLQNDLLNFGYENKLDKIYTEDELKKLNHNQIGIIIYKLKLIHSEYYVSDLINADMSSHYYDALGGY